MVSKINKNSRFIFGLITGVLLSIIGVYATAKLSSSDVLYDNSKSGGSSSDVQGSLEELYQKTKDYKPCSSAVWEANNKYFTDAYTYNPSTCVTGDEETCLRTDCYISSKKICPVGTIIDYVVSGNSNKVRFHVMSDDGETVTMQSQKNIVNNVQWYMVKDNTKGPLTILEALENITNSWTHVKDQTYTMGTTVFKGNAYTGCSGNSYGINSCTKNKYTLKERTKKVRMMTAQEAYALGCTNSPGTCPIWMLNFAPEATTYKGTQNDDNGIYWLMSTTTESTSARMIWRGYVSGTDPTVTYAGARAVVVVSK